MKTYAVTVRAIVAKTLRVEAEDQEAAIAIAHEDFTTELTDDLEDYEEETLRIEEVQS
jgi:hypothetical protein